MRAVRSAALTDCRWHVLGSGAMGSLLGALLAEAGEEVMFVNTKPGVKTRAGVDLTLERKVGQTSRHFASALAPECEPISRLIVATKAYTLPHCLQPVLPHLAPGCSLFFLQNGVGWDGEVAALLSQYSGGFHLLGGSITFGAHRVIEKSTMSEEHGQVRVIDVGAGDLFLGPLRFLQVGSGGAAPSREEIQTADDDLQQRPLQALAAAVSLDADKRVSVMCADELAKKRWAKLAVNAVINGLTARHRCRNGHLLGLSDGSDAQVRSEYDELLEEVGATFEGHGLVGESSSAVFRSKSALRDLVTSVATETANNVSSTLQDVLNGRETELAYMNGQVKRMADALGIELQVNSTICARYCS